MGVKRGEIGLKAPSKALIKARACLNDGKRTPTLCLTAPESSSKPLLLQFVFEAEVPYIALSVAEFSKGSGPACFRFAAEPRRRCQSALALAAPGRRWHRVTQRLGCFCPLQHVLACLRSASPLALYSCRGQWGRKSCVLRQGRFTIYIHPTSAAVVESPR